jgi:hypothetical protein
MMEVLMSRSLWIYSDMTVSVGITDTGFFLGSPTICACVATDGGCHIVYNAIASAHICEIVVDDGYQFNDLTAAAEAPGGSSGALSAYAFNTQGTLHVIYLGDDFHIHELWRDTAGWHHNDLTLASGAPSGISPPAPDCSPTGYAFEAQGTQHVNYVRGDGHVIELWWDNTGWHHNDLTVAAAAPLSSVGNGYAVSGYVFGAQGTQHVNYLGQDFHIHELWWDNNGWHHNDLTIASGADPADDIAYPNGYVYGSRQHVVYMGSDEHVHLLWWDSSGWHHTDVTVEARAPAVLGAVSLPIGVAYGVANNAQSVFYRDGNLHLIQLYGFAEP